MPEFYEPSRSDLLNLVRLYFKTQPKGLGIAAGCASPSFPEGRMFFFGNVQNQFGQDLALDPHTPFEIASVSKTFTSTLYVDALRSLSGDDTLAIYTAPSGLLPISPKLGKITLDSLMSYSSGLPADNLPGPTDLPPFLPQPYSQMAMLNYLNAAPPALVGLNEQYLYSNLGFALMGAILSGDSLELRSFTDLVAETLFQPLGMKSCFFDWASLERLPQGFNYDYSVKPNFSAVTPGWPLFPAYFGAGGIVASAADMLQWLLFNMGLISNDLSPTLAATQSAATTVKWGDQSLGLGWFLSPAAGNFPATVWKDGDLDGFRSYIAFTASNQPGVTAANAGAFVMINALGVTVDQTNSGPDLAVALTNDIINLILGQSIPEDKSSYPGTLRGRSRLVTPR
ncbi:beta-lactamase [Methylocella silvestris BL2]|uniref:Beta-lactamase n=1 Tax=Methylocella silvestris (strain DSM 15510 / CIP 108128 / LMG 27833 / NCIMB 13906 / BL2) TaxID=395965 RepID=B8EI90_METSB|nr:serine hydrolase domain-containing protein [Methylocella silvestris]ACK50572.1 beta-lactamase [Methylocella silvestris BL2]